jgi:pimeloyl-ACP methyl ester carboxylesterase
MRSTKGRSNWIFLRGLMRESGHWGDFVAQFQRALPGSRVVTLDLPGNGALHGTRSPSSVPELVAQCRAQMQARHIAPPYNLLAMSLGAMVALEWACEAPQDVSALVLINTSLRPYSPVWQRLRPANYGALLRLALFGGTPLGWECTVLRLTSNRGDASVLPRWLQLRQQHPVSRANALRQLVAAARYEAPHRLPRMPVLVLGSEPDRLVSVACSKALALQGAYALRLHPAAGHDLPLDDGPWVAQQVRQWLADGCPAAPGP